MSTHTTQQNLSAYLVGACSYALVAIALLYVTMLWGAGNNFGAAAMMWGAACGAFIPLLLRMTKAVAAVTHALLATAMGVFTLATTLSGGLSSPCALWLVLVPVLAVALLGRVGGIIWGGVAIAIVLCYYPTGPLGTLAIRFGASDVDSFRLLTQCLLLASTAGTVSLFGSSHRRQFRTDTSDFKPSTPSGKDVEAMVSTIMEGEDSYRLMTENIQDLICTVSVDGRLLHCSPVVTEFGGYERADVIGTHVTDYFADDKGKRQCIETLRRAAAEQSPGTLEFLYKPKTGKPFHAEVRGKPLVIDGRVRAIHCVLRNIEDRKRTETALAKSRDRLAATLLRERQTSRALEETVRKLDTARQQAQAADIAKSEFLANMSHEIRTPLTAIMGHIELLAEYCRGDCEYGRTERVVQTDTITRNAEHLLRLLNDILDISKIEAGKMAIECVACSPAEVIADVVSMQRPRVEQKNLEIVMQCDGPIPQTIHSDPTRLRQILFNLLANAVKFTHHGGITVTSRLENGNDPKLAIMVSDTGIGIAEENFPHLFDTFSQGDASTTRQFGGTGLGLAISKRLAQMLGGDIRVESEVGKGTTFTVVIATGPIDDAEFTSTIPDIDTEAFHTPSSTASKQNEHAQKVQAEKASTQHPQARRRVLVAEDGVDNQRLISVILRKAENEVVVAEHGGVALELARSSRDAGHPFDLILMDMQMPTMDGYEATRRLREEGFGMPIIALTAHAMSGDREKCIAAGCDDYTTKPIQRQNLVALVERLAPCDSLLGV